MINIFNKKKKEKIKYAEDGVTRILEHKEKNKEEFSIAPAKYVEEIENFFENLYPNGETTVFHEILSNIIHLDVHVIKPTEDRPFYVLHTTGMSDLPMNLPKDLLPEYGHLKHAELKMLVPKDWVFKDLDLDMDEIHYWVIRVLKELAKMPHIYDTWLGWGHTIPNGDYVPYSTNTDLSCMLLLSEKEEFSVIKTKDGNQVNIYTLIPLYKEEAEFKLNNGMDALLDKLFETNEFSLVVNLNRKNAVK